MSERRLDRLFLRYRRKGDAAALGEVFDRAAPELLKLSMHLVRDPVEAEDVLQATFLAAIEGADSFDASRPLMPWLTGILARQAGLVRRRARRVVEPDRLTQRETQDPAEVAALREFSAELVIALQELPDNYREVLWLHLADGKRPVEIAQDLKRAPGTVRMQVHRGLELLRRALPAGYAAGTGILGATRGLAAIRAEVLADAAARWRPPPLPPGSAHSPGSIAGALGAASTATKLTLALLALAAILTTAWWRVRPLATDGDALARSETEGTVLPGATPARESSDPSGARTALVRESAIATDNAAALAKPIFLRGHVLGIRGSERSEVQLTVRAIARFALPAELVIHGAPAADGSFEFDVTRLFDAAKPKRPLEELIVDADHPRYVRESLHIPLGRPIERAYSADLQLSPAGQLSGRVLTPQSEPAAAASVALYALVDGVPLEPPVDRGACAADGTFALRARASGDHVLLVFSDDARPATIAATLTPGASVALGAIVLDEGALIEGQAFHQGQPLEARALVSASATSGQAIFAISGSRLSWDGAHFERTGRIVETDADGRFRISGLAPGAYRLGVARAAPQGAEQSQRRLVLSTAAWTVVEAPATRALIHSSFAIAHLRVVAQGSAALSTHKPAKVRWRQSGNSTEFPLEFDALGSVSVEPRAACSVHVEAEGFLAQDMTFDAPGPGLELTQVLVLRSDPALARVSIEIRTPKDLPLSPITEAAFQFTPREPADSNATEFQRHATSADGVFHLTDLPAGDWSVSVYAGGVYEHFSSCWCEAKLSVRLSPASPASAVVLLERGGPLQISAINSQGSCVAAECTLSPLGGEPLRVAFVGRGPQGSLVSPRTLSALGPCDVHPIPRAGKYEITLRAKGHEPARVLVDIEAGICSRVKAVLQEQGAQR